MAKHPPFRLEPVEGDGLPAPVVGPWGDRKYSLVGHFSHLFATGMKNKWKHRIYMDLFSGPGRVRFTECGPIYNSTPLIALSTTDPFDRYIFGDADHDALAVLKARVEKLFPSMDARFVEGDANEVVEDALSKIPTPSAQNTVLTFCVLDPFDVASLHFRTIEAITRVYVDFFVLIASHMDAGRNWRLYQRPDNPTVDLFLGRSDWRQEWEKPEVRRDGFGPFIVEAFTESMRRLTFGRGMLEPVRLPRNKTPLYYLAGFSKHKVGLGFWHKAHKSSHPQQFLPFGD
jgi:three-Cys-motif partner protein